MNNLSKYYIIVLTILFSNQLYSQSCIGKDFSRAEWFEKDSLISNVIENYPNVIKNLIVRDKCEIVVENLTSNVENVILYDVEGKMFNIDFIVTTISETSISLKSDDLKLLKSGVYFLHLQTKDKSEIFKLFIIK